METTRKRKFTDEEYLNLYNQGISDTKISKIFNCSRSSVRIRRIKLRLIANNPNFSGKTMSLYELEEEQKRRINRITEKYKLPENKIKRKKWLKQFSKSLEYRNRQRKYSNTYNRRPEVKKKKMEIRNSLEGKQKQKEYYEKNKERDYIIQRKRLQTPEGKIKRKKYMREYHCGYYQRPLVKIRKKETNRMSYLKKKKL